MSGSYLVVLHMISTYLSPSTNKHKTLGLQENTPLVVFSLLIICFIMCKPVEQKEEAYKHSV